MPVAFAALDRVYAQGGATSSAELRRWTADPKNEQRAALALFYLARNEARLSKNEKSRQLFAEFLEKYPGHFLAEDARAELAASQLSAAQAREALQTLQSGRGFRNAFVRAQSLATLGQYKEAAAAFLQASGAAELERTALENSAICALLAGVAESENDASLDWLSLRLSLQPLNGFAFSKRCFKPRSEPRRPQVSFARSRRADLRYPHRVRLALAEWAYLRTSAQEAQTELLRVSTDDPSTIERTEYLAIFLGDTADPESEAQTVKLAEAFLARYANSPFEPEVRMKLGEVLYRRGDYLGARGQFGIVAEKFSDSPLAEKAVFLTAHAMARSLDAAEMEEAIGIFEQVAKSGGLLSSRARLAQANLLNALKRPKEALGVLDGILELKPDAELRYAVLIEKGDTFFCKVLKRQKITAPRSLHGSW